MISNYGIFSIIFDAGCKFGQRFEPKKIPMLLDLNRLNENPTLSQEFLLKTFLILDREHIGPLALVCKLWRDILESPSFYDIMFAKHRDDIFDEHDWHRHYGHPGLVPPIPERLMRIFCRTPSSLLLKPAEVTRHEGDEPEPLNLRSIAAWSSDPLFGNAVNYAHFSWQRPLNTLVEPPVTSWILLGHKPFSTIQEKKAAKTLSVALWYFTEKVRSGNYPVFELNRIQTAEVMNFRAEQFTVWGHQVFDVQCNVNVRANDHGVILDRDLNRLYEDQTAFLIEWNEDY